MITLTAILRCKPGSDAHIRAALLETARYASEKEPGTVSYFVSEAAEGGVFVGGEGDGFELSHDVMGALGLMWVRAKAQGRDAGNGLRARRPAAADQSG